MSIESQKKVHPRLNLNLNWLFYFGAFAWLGWVLYGQFRQLLGNSVGTIVLAMAVSATIIVLFIAWAISSNVKNRFLQAMPDGLEVFPANIADYPALDRAQFDHYVQTFERLGFVHLMDFRVDFRHGLTTPGFARLFYHPTQFCFGEVNQVFPASGKKVPVRSSISSSFQEKNERQGLMAAAKATLKNAGVNTDAGKINPDILERMLDREWTLSTIDRAVDKYLYILRRPRSLWHRDTNATLEQLFDMHLQRRAHILRHLKLDLQTELTRESYIARSAHINVAMRRALLRKNMLVGLWEMKKVGPHTTEWWGAYAKYASRP